jgi:hypothetical protein
LIIAIQQPVRGDSKPAGAGAGAGGDLNGSQSPEGCLRYAVSVLNRHFFRASEGFCRHGIFHGITIVQENKPLNI